MKMIFMNMENSKTTEPYKFAFNISQRLDLKRSNKHRALQNLLLHKEKYKHNKLKIIAPTQNDEFELPDGSYYVSHIQDGIKYIIKKHETLTTIPLNHVYINRINNRLALKK